MKTNTKRLIEKKQGRLQRFVNQGRLAQPVANRQVLQYAKLVVKILGMDA